MCYLFPEPTYFFFSSDIPALLYYTHIPTIAISLLVGFFVFWNGKNLLLNQLFLGISIFFSLWTIIDLIAWTNTHSELILSVWSLLGLLFSFISIFCIYFIYVFLKKKDISLKIKSILILLLAPVAFLSSSSFNLSGFNITACDAFEFEHIPFQSYYTLLGVLAIVWIFVLLVQHYRVATLEFKKQITLMGIGIELFIFSFFFMVFIGSYFTGIGLLPDSQLEFYGLFGMMIFIVYISILIVRFKAFNVKLIATQALVWGLAILIGSQFFFIKVPTNFVLNGIGFLAAIILGQYLIRSVKKEIAQREELAKLNIDLQDLLKQRESLVHLVTHKVKGSFTRSKYIFAGILDGTFGDINPEIKKRAEQGLESDNMGIETVDLVLNVANMQKGLIKYDMKNVNFKEIILKSIEDKKISAEAKGLKLETDIKPVSPSQGGDGEYNILGDVIWLKEAVNNLIENSIKYTKEGKILVGLEKKDNKIKLYVQDNGVGITEDDKRNLFTEGGRGKDSVKVNVDSTGYGLYTVKLIVEAHKGKVWVESEGTGKGSTFFVELPS